MFENLGEGMTDWFCPDTDSFTLLNHFDATYKNGKDFRLIVDVCDTELPSCSEAADSASRFAFFESISINT